jgi:3-oxoacyl-[acyl-carrier protein] reductase
VNLGGTFILFQEALTHMSAGAPLIAISSRGVLGDNEAVAYIASKAAIVGLVRALAFELRRADIAVNAIAPGFTDTAMVRDAYDPARFAAAAPILRRSRTRSPSSRPGARPSSPGRRSS